MQVISIYLYVKDDIPMMKCAGHSLLLQQFTLCVL